MQWGSSRSPTRTLGPRYFFGGIFQHRDGS